ncbi:MAG: PLDc N-terminal domain-containing protein [Rhodospirillales bacterium]|jgi:threonine/homoserine/homoserine lactone efflux protein|nr:PLDc N-terminal domain-containing protein [Rhodospirillales bacterium]
MEIAGGLIGIIVLVLTVWAGLNIVLSNASMMAKVLWIVGIILLPIIGFIAWLFFGPRKAG